MSKGGFVRDERKNPFVMIAVELIDRFGPLIGANGIAVYIVLARYANRTTRRTYVSLKLIAKKLAISQATVSRAIAALIQYRLVHRESGKLKGAETEYILRDVPREKLSDSAPLFDNLPEGSINMTHPPQPGKTPLVASVSYIDQAGGVSQYDSPPSVNMTYPVSHIDLPGESKTRGGVSQNRPPYKEEPDEVLTRLDRVVPPSSSLTQKKSDDDGENQVLGSIRETDQAPGSVRDEYIRKVLDAYRETPGTTGTAHSSDSRIAGDLFDRKIALQDAINGITLGAARRLFRDGGAPPGDVRSLAYFRAVIDEVGETEVSDDYYRHLRSSLEKFVRKNELARIRTASASATEREEEESRLRAGWGMAASETGD